MSLSGTQGLFIPAFSENTRLLNKFIAAIEKEGKEFGMKLNYKKCEVLLTGKRAAVKYGNKELIQHVETIKYLGCDLNRQGDTGK